MHSIYSVSPRRRTRYICAVWLKLRWIFACINMITKGKLSDFWISIHLYDLILFIYGKYARQETMPATVSSHSLSRSFFSFNRTYSTLSLSATCICHIIMCITKSLKTTTTTMMIIIIIVAKRVWLFIACAKLFCITIYFTWFDRFNVDDFIKFVVIWAVRHCKSIRWITSLCQNDIIMDFELQYNHSQIILCLCVTHTHICIAFNVAHLTILQIAYWAQAFPHTICAYKSKTGTFLYSIFINWTMSRVISKILIQIKSTHPNQKNNCRISNWLALMNWSKND